MPLQDSTTADTASVLFGVGVLVALLVWGVFVLIAGWKMYAKAGQPGWVAIIPLVSTFGLVKIVHRPLWWMLLLIVPFVNIVVFIILMSDLAKAFGKGLGMTLLLVLLTPIAYLVLGFGEAEYQLQPDPLFG